MKKLIIILTILFFLPTILAANITMKSEFDSQETLIAKLSGEFLQPVLDENVFFYRGHVRVPMDYDIAKIQDDFYIYAILPQIQTKKNYSLRIENVRYIQDGKSTDDEIKKDFSILNQTAEFNVKPGFVVASDDFSIEVKNLKDYEIEIKSETEKSGIFSSLFGSGKQTTTLESGKTEKINFELKDFDSGLQTIKLSTDNSNYEIPVYIYVSEQKDKEKQTEDEEEQKQEEEEIEEHKPSPQAIKTCAELGGKICPLDEECVGDYTYALDEKCCFGTCEKPKTPPWKIFGWGIIILIILIIVVFLRKYKGTKKPFDLLNITKKK